MGGNTFETPATRLTIPQHTAAFDHCRDALVPRFFSRALMPRYLTSKTSHGDLDMVLAWEGAGLVPMKGMRKGVVGGGKNKKGPAGGGGRRPGRDGARGEGDESARTSSSNGCLPDANGAVGTMSSALEGLSLSANESVTHPPVPEAPITFASPARELDAWCGTVAAAIGGTQWLWNGGEISVAVPMRILAGSSEQGLSERSDVANGDCNDVAQGVDNAAPESFFQVDLILVHPTSATFTAFISSYVSLNVILGELIRASTSTAVTLQQQRVILRGSPWPGLPGVEVELTRDVAALCSWLGLGYDEWQRSAPHIGDEEGRPASSEPVSEPWGSEEQMYTWLSTVDPNSLASRGLRTLASRLNTTYRGRNTRYAGVGRFMTWLKERGWGPEHAQIVTDDRSNGVPTMGRSQLHALTETETETSAPVDPPNPLPHQLNPDRPAPLPAGGEDALLYWGKKTEYDGLVAAGRGRALDLFETRRRRSKAP